MPSLRHFQRSNTLHIYTVVIPNYIEERTRQFYAWEKRGRGWELCDEPVQLEPAYAPFFFRYVRPYMDDGKRPTVLSAIADWVKGKQPPPVPENYQPLHLEPFPFEDTSPLVFLTVLLPKGYVAKDTALEGLLTALSYTRHPVSIELVATSDTITVQLVVREPDAGYVTGQLKAFIPGCVVHDASEELENIAKDSDCTFCVDFGLKEEFMRPLALKTNTDNQISFFAVLDGLEGTERVSFQFLFSGLINDWSESMLDSVTTNSGDSFFYDAPEMPSVAKEKGNGRMCAATVRLVTQSETVEAAMTLAEVVCMPFLHGSTSAFNSLVPLLNEDYDFDARIDDLLNRASCRQGMILNVRELVSILHFPSTSVCRKLLVDTEHTNPPPDTAQNHEYTLGTNIHHGVTKRVSLAVAQRLKHMHIIGATGTGKSTLLLQLIVQDIKHGNGLAVLDPHGDLIETILHYIPEHRIKDVVIVDPADSEYPVGFNILTAHSDIEKEILASDLVSVFKKFSSSWGDQMNSVFANAILAFLESSTGGTLSDLRKFLIEKPFRDEVLATVKDEHIVYYWQKEYPLLKNSSVGSILTRLDGFLRPKVIRNMVVQKQSLDFEALMDSKKIVLVKLSHGLIGAENSYLLGSFIVSKIQQAAMGRQAKAKDLRSEFYLYIDEFQHFTTDSMTVILSGARKYGLGLVLAHQGMQQLQKEDSSLASSVIANAGTRICFRLGENDARLFNNSFASFSSEDLQRLDTGKAIARIERSDHDFTLNTIPLPVISQPQEYLDRIIASSRQLYATRKEDIQSPEPPGSGVEAKPVPPKPKPPAPTPLSQPPAASAERLSPEPAPPSVSEPTVPLQQSDTMEQLIKQKQQSQHRYLQTLIKKLAETKGYKATIEKPTPDGKGKIDIALEKDGIVTACEISVTTDAQWEWHNLRKCLEAGSHKIIMACTEKRTRDTLEQKLSELRVADRPKVTICSPDAFMASIQNEAIQQEPAEKIMKGYRVKVKYNQAEDTDARQKQSEITRIMRGK